MAWKWPVIKFLGQGLYNGLKFLGASTAWAFKRPILGAASGIGLVWLGNKIKSNRPLATALRYAMVTTGTFLISGAVTGVTVDLLKEVPKAVGERLYELTPFMGPSMNPFF